MGETAFRSRDPLLTAQEVADELRLHVNVILRMAKAGKLPGAFRTGERHGVWRIPRSGLESYVQDKQREFERARPRPAAKRKAQAS